MVSNHLNLKKHSLGITLLCLLCCSVSQANSSRVIDNLSKNEYLDRLSNDIGNYFAADDNSYEGLKDKEFKFEENESIKGGGV
jgi:hypothetical protein